MAQAILYRELTLLFFHFANHNLTDLSGAEHLRAAAGIGSPLTPAHHTFSRLLTQHAGLVARHHRGSPLHQHLCCNRLSLIQRRKNNAPFPWPVVGFISTPAQ